MLTKLYYIVFFITVIKSLIVLRRKKTSSQDCFYIFLIINFLIDYFSEINILAAKAIQYNYLNLFNIVFFLFFYYRKISNNLIFILILTSTIICIFLTSHFFFFDKYNLSLAVLYCLGNILYSLYWINLKLNNISDNKITDEPIFWISIALLIWSCFFLFRIIPMYLLEKDDKPFLKLLKNILLIINIIVYILFYIGLTKYKRTKDEILTT